MSASAAPRLISKWIFMHDYRKKHAALCIVLFAVCVAIAGCGHKEEATGPPPPSGAATLNPDAQAQMQAQRQAESAARSAHPTH